MPLSPVELGLIFVAGIGGGAVNAIAGGGSLITFPTLIALGLPPITANATNAVAMWPGSLSSALAFRDRLPEIRQQMRQLFLPTLVGGACGAWLLMNTPEKVFKFLVPVLILLATILLIFQPQLKKLAQTEKGDRLTAAQSGQFVIATYGGYFGAGMGILMLACYGLTLSGKTTEHNALKNWMAVVINFSAAILFVGKGLVNPFACVAVMGGAVIGGYNAARLSERVSADTLRWIVIAIGAAMSIWFTAKAVMP